MRGSSINIWNEQILEFCSDFQDHARSNAVVIITEDFHVVAKNDDPCV